MRENPIRRDPTIAKIFVGLLNEYDYVGNAYRLSKKVAKKHTKSVTNLFRSSPMCKQRD